MPVLRLAVFLVGRDDPSAKLYCVEIKGVCAAVCCKPYVLAAVFPISSCSAPLFSLPGDAVADVEVFTEYTSDYKTAFPIAADVDRAVILEQRLYSIKPGARVLFIFVGTFFGKGELVEALCQIIRRVRNDQINAFFREQGTYCEHVPEYCFICNGAKVGLLLRYGNTTVEKSLPLAQGGVDCFVSASLYLCHSCLLFGIFCPLQ